MKKIVIICATDIEYKFLVEIKNKILNKKVIVAKSGIGKSLAAATVQKMIDLHKPDHIINAGLAGGIGKDIKPLDVVMANATAHHDFDLRKFGYEYGQIPGFETKTPCDNLGLEYKKGLIVSGDIFSTKDHLLKVLAKFKDAIAIDMESASINTIAYQEKVPCSIIRVISDSPLSKDNSKQYENLALKSSQKLSETIYQVIKGKF